MEAKSGVQISRKAFLQSAFVIFVLMIFSGILTRAIPAGQFDRVELEGREVIDPTTFRYIERPDYPVWRWLTAPVEILWAENSILVIGIILFILLVGMAFAVIDRTGILQAVLGGLVKALGGRKYVLLVVIAFFFMALGGFFGILEDVIPLVPISIALAYWLGWDSLTGMGMSILAANVGFSTAIFNPFTIGVAHRLSGLPTYSGAGLRLVLFFVVYVILAVFLVQYARKIERKPEDSPVFHEDQGARPHFTSFRPGAADLSAPRMRIAAIFLAVMFALILVVMIATPFVPFLSDMGLIVTGVLFVIGGVGAGVVVVGLKAAGKAAGQGLLGILPAVPLLLMATSVRHIVASGGILDTVLYEASQVFAGASPFWAVMGIYGVTLVMELFVGSGSAKALLLIPILMPLVDLVGVNRQIAVSAYTFGDGFSNLVYPTNAMLLITLSLTVVPFTKWARWVMGLWIWVFLATVAFLAVAVAINYGPF